jgi:hypothetical protein
MQVRQQNWWHGLVSATDSLEHRFINKLICCNTTSLANWFTEAQNHQRTDSLQPRFVSESSDTDSSANWFAGTQIHQRTVSLQHKLVSELICYNASSAANTVHIGDSWLKNHWQNWVVADWEIINTTQFCNWRWNHQLKYFTVGVGIVDENWVIANSEIINIIYVVANFQIGSGDEVVSGSTSFFQSIVWFMLGFPLPTFLNLFRHRT